MMNVDLDRLLETRLLVQANSGGGKSWALRWLLEHTAGRVQQLVIDPEGEFATLRERFDYIVCAPSGADAVATPQTAAALARALWGAGTSAILDIYELKAHERTLFVRRFIESLVNAPRTMWHPTLVVLDEIHVFAPQAGDAESRGAVIDLATRGRKRGLALVGATQRLSKLHKDAAAELLNKLVGRTGLDVDVQRAADELGMPAKAATEALRNLEPGEFFSFGPALSRTVERVKVGAVLTTHPQSGHRALSAPPPASATVLAQLAKLEGLQRDAEQEARTLDDLRAEVTKLRRALTIAEKASGQQGVPEAEVQRRIDAAVAAKVLPLNAAPLDIGRLQSIRDAAQTIQHLAEIVLGHGDAAAPPLRQTPSKRATAAPLLSNAAPAPRVAVPTPAPGVTVPQQRILDALARLAAFDITEPQKPVVAAMAGVSSKSSGYQNNLGSLRSAGLVAYPSGGAVALTDAGRAAANAPERAATLEDLHAGWLAMVPRPQAAILQVLLDHYPEPLRKGDLAATVGVSASSSGYQNNLGALRSIGALTYPAPGTVVATELLFPKGRISTPNGRANRPMEAKPE